MQRKLNHKPIIAHAINLIKAHNENGNPMADLDGIRRGRDFAIIRQFYWQGRKVILQNGIASERPKWQDYENSRIYAFADKAEKDAYLQKLIKKADAKLDYYSRANKLISIAAQNWKLDKTAMGELAELGENPKD